MEGYEASTYGEAFADVYDDWYTATLGDRSAFAAMAFGLAVADLPILELGIGTGRLAVALAAAGLHVVGVDTSAAMVARIPPVGEGPGSVTPVVGDMVEDLPAGPFGLAYCGFNTFFNLLSERRQQDCLTAVADRLAPGAAFIVEASIPEPPSDPADEVRLRSMTATEVVLSVSRVDRDGQRAEGQYVSLSAAGGVRLRPWAIRWCTPTQLDELAACAGLELVGRYAGYDRAPLTDDDDRHVTVYRRPVDYPPVRHAVTTGDVG